MHTYILMINIMSIPSFQTGIVAEVTDDKSLEKQERKQLQIAHAPHSSHQAKLVKLADKLYNLR